MNSRFEYTKKLENLLKKEHYVMHVKCHGLSKHATRAETIDIYLSSDVLVGTYVFDNEIITIHYINKKLNTSIEVSEENLFNYLKAMSVK